MSMKVRITGGALALVVSLINSTEAQQVQPPKFAADVLGTPAGTVMTKECVETVGQLAYVWGWPLANNLNRALAVEKLPEPIPGKSRFTIFRLYGPLQPWFDQSWKLNDIEEVK